MAYSEYTIEEYRRHRAEIDDIGSDPKKLAKWRASLSKLIADKTSEKAVIAEVEVASVRRYLLTGGDVAYRDFVEVNGERVKLPRVEIPFAAGASPANFAVAGANIRAGVCAIIGKGGIGKTPVAHALAGASGKYAVIRAGEPFAGYSTDAGDVAASLLTAMATHRAVVLDSVKDLLSGGGAAMKSGLSRDALTQLSSWSIAAANLGCTVFVPVNPSTDDDDVSRMLIEAMRSNVTSTFVPVSDATWKYSTRSGEGGKRETVSVPVDFDEDGMAILGAREGTSHHNAMLKVELGEEVFNAALQRALTTN